MDLVNNVVGIAIGTEVRTVECQADDADGVDHSEIFGQVVTSLHFDQQSIDVRAGINERMDVALANGLAAWLE